MHVSVRPRAGLGVLLFGLALIAVVVALNVVMRPEQQPLHLIQTVTMVVMGAASVYVYRDQQRQDPLRLVVGPDGLRLHGATIPWDQVDEIRYRRPRAPLSWLGGTGSVAVVQGAQRRFAARAGIRPDATVLGTSQLDHTAAEVMDAIALHAPAPLRARLPAPWGTGDATGPRTPVDAGNKS